MAQKKNNLRIISGTWRSRRIQIIDKPEIRPTPDRVRETLFNWLSNSIISSTCLDLFAGSGVLGFEAASRGAKHVVLVEKDKSCAEMLLKQKQILGATRLDVVHQDALTYLQNSKQEFDLVFLDPPFKSPLLQRALITLLERKILISRGLLYVEASSHSESPQSLQDFHCLREKVAGEVRYALYQKA